MKNPWIPLVSAMTVAAMIVAASADELHLACSARNDLYKVLVASKVECRRHETAAEAVSAAQPGAGVMVLADGYPRNTTQIAPDVFDRAAAKKLKLYVEYPASLPGLKVGQARRARLERAVVASDVFGQALPPTHSVRVAQRSLNAGLRDSSPSFIQWDSIAQRRCGAGSSSQEMQASQTRATSSVTRG